MHAYYSDHFALPLPAGHRFPMEKYALLREQVAQACPGVQLVPAPAASDAELALVHAAAYVRGVVTGQLDPAHQREIGFPWSPALVERSRRSVGATIAAARMAMRDGVAVNLAGGTHHATADRGGGYCVFNDVAVAARVIQRDFPGVQGALRRVAVIDLDVHQGNGTAAIFSGDISVFTLSLHGARNFPFRKVAGDLDIELADGCGDDEYLLALEEALDAVWRRFDPQFVCYLAGADPYEGDRLGRLSLSMSGLAQRDAMVLSLAARHGVPAVVVMAGGYAQNPAHTVAIQRRTVQLAYEHWCAWTRSAPQPRDLAA